MHPSPTSAKPDRTAVFVAATIERDAFLGEVAPASAAGAPDRKPLASAATLDLRTTGIGKVNAALSASSTLDVARHRAAISLGIAGTLPGGPPIGSVVVATGSVWADEGVRTPEGFLTCEAIGFPIGPYPEGVVPINGRLADEFAARLEAHRGLIATVSACSGVDWLARERVSRTGAIAEAMEGAAIGHVAQSLGIAFVEIRIISNSTGDRGRQQWELKQALSVLGRVARVIADFARVDP